jgi:hypothetical protein
LHNFKTQGLMINRGLPLLAQAVTQISGLWFESCSTVT